MNSNKPSNIHTQAEVAVLFLEPQIRELFAELLAARGLKVSELASPSEFSGETKIITEPIYFPLINTNSKEQCLVVGNSDAMGKIQALCLARPLTEEKIENALKAFLG